MAEIRTNSGKINVSAGANAVNVNVTKDYSSYFSQLSKDWAVKTSGLVNNEDYSSKYYAGKSKDWAVNSENNLNSVISQHEQITSEITQAREDISTDLSGALLDIETSKNAGLTAIDNVKTNGVTAVNTAKDGSITAIQKAQTTAETSIESLQTSAEKTVTIGIANIETSKKNAISDITTVGTEQVANIKQTGFYMQDDKLYYIDANGETKEFKSSSSGFEVCDIGTALYIDETKGLRRRLNGQIVDINTNTQGFLDKLKEIKVLAPSLFCTEEEWQTIKSASKLGQCGKFVFNYSGAEIISVRIPAVVNINGLVYLANAGVIKAESLPNITGSTNNASNIGNFTANTTGTGAVSITAFPAANSGVTDGRNHIGNVINIDASNSSSTYQDNAPVQQEAIQYPYFIQIATGVETEVNIKDTLDLNNPFTFGMNMHFKGKMENISWLKSANQQNVKALYPDFYNWVLENVNKGASGFLGQTMYMFGSADGGYYCSTQTPQVGAVLYGSANNNTTITAIVTKVYDNGNIDISDFSLSISFTNVGRYPAADKSSADYITDYDFEINTTDETFRLPLKNGNEHIPDYSNGTVITSTEAFIVPSNGVVAGTIDASKVANKSIIINGQKVESVWGGGTAQDGCPFYAKVKKGDSVVIEKISTSNDFAKPTFYPFVGNGSLYYYVGETVQNANLIDVGRISENLVSKLDTPPRYPVGVSDKSLMPSWYVVYNDGWCEQGGIMTGSGAGSRVTLTFLKPYINAWFYFNSKTLSTYTGAWTGQFESITNVTPSSINVWGGASGDYIYWYSSGYVS